MCISESGQNITHFQRIEYFLKIINRMLSGFVTIYVSWLCLRRPDIPWHAFFCTIGFNFIMVEGFLCYSEGNSILTSRNTKIWFHVALQISGSLLGIAGIVIRIRIDEVHFTTLHGRLGLSALILSLLSLSLGFNAVFSAKMTNIMQPVLNKTFHNVIAVATLTIALIASIYGFDTDVFSKISPENGDSLVNVAKVLKISVGTNLILSIYVSLFGLFKKWRNYFITT